MRLIKYCYDAMWIGKEKETESVVSARKHKLQ